MTEINDHKTFWKRSTMEIITFTEGTLMDIIQLARKDILSLITTTESLQNMNCAECSNKDEELEKWKNEGLRLMAVNQHLEIDFQSQKEEIEKMWDVLRDASFIIDPQHTGILKRISEISPRKGDRAI